MAMSSLVDADYRAKGGEVGSLFGKGTIKEAQPAVQEQDRGSGAADFRI
jgi:hypothetical protein